MNQTIKKCMKQFYTGIIDEQQSNQSIQSNENRIISQSNENQINNHITCNENFINSTNISQNQIQDQKDQKQNESSDKIQIQLQNISQPSIQQLQQKRNEQGSLIQEQQQDNLIKIQDDPREIKQETVELKQNKFEIEQSELMSIEQNIGVQINKSEERKENQNSFEQQNINQSENDKENKSQNLLQEILDQTIIFVNYMTDKSEKNQPIIKNENMVTKSEGSENQDIFTNINSDSKTQENQIQLISVDKMNLEDYFNIVNKGLDLQNQQQYFEEVKQQILQELQQLSYYLGKYITQGGQGLIFEGISQFQNEKQIIIKIYLRPDFNQICQESKILKQIDAPNIYRQNIVVSYLPLAPVSQKPYQILIVEKCQFSLFDELMMIAKNKIEYTIEKVFKMIIGLLNGLIDLQLLKIIHNDIKPGNILVKQNGEYAYSDFGSSLLKEKFNNIQFSGECTERYAAPEVLNIQLNKICFKSDIYSLGKVFQDIIKVFKQRGNYDQNKSLIDIFEKIIKVHMVQYNIHERSDCLSLLSLFFSQMNSHQQQQYYKDSYLFQIIVLKIIMDYQSFYDEKYFRKLKIFYFQQFSEGKNNINIDKKYFYLLIYLLQQIEDQEQVFYYLNKLFQEQDLDLENQIYYYQMLGDFGYYNVALSGTLKLLENKINQSEQLNIQELKGYCFNNIGIYYELLNQPEKGLQYSQQSFEIRKKTNFTQLKQEYIAQSLNNIGVCYMRIEDEKNAFSNLLESNKIYLEMDSYKKHRTLIISNFNVGRCYLKFGYSQKAVEYILLSLKLSQIYYSKKENIRKLILNELVKCYLKLGDLPNAIKYSLEFMRISIKNQSYKDIFYSLVILSELLIKLKQE